MAQYGQAIDGTVEPWKDRVYDLFSSYFGNPMMTKMRDVDSFSMYMTKIHSLLGIEFRYIIAFTHKDNSPPGLTKRMDSVRWVSLQTRALTEDHNLPPHSYVPSRLPGLDRRITLQHYDQNQYVYDVEAIPIVVTILARKSKQAAAADSRRGPEYSTTGTIVPALETYQTIITFKQ